NDGLYRHQVIARAANTKVSNADQAWETIPALRTIKLAIKLEQHGAKLRNQVASFFLAALTFTPINLGILCFLSGRMGGCLSRTAYQRLMAEGKIDKASDRVNGAADQSENAAKHNVSETRLFYLSEHPFSSGIRSFMVYLLLLAGLYLATG